MKKRFADWALIRDTVGPITNFPIFFYVCFTTYFHFKARILFSMKKKTDKIMSKILKY